MSNIIDLAVGDPAGSSPKMLRDVLADSVALPPSNHYTSPEGLVVAREAVQRYYALHQGVPVDAANVAITHGARPAIHFGLRALGSAGDSVGYFVPAYIAFWQLIVNADMRPVPIPLPEGRLARDALTTLLEPIKGKFLIVNNPHNPTGRVFDQDELHDLCEVAKEFGIRLLSDYVYADLHEGEAPISLLTIEPMAIEIISISKSFRACGWRVGAVVGNPDWVGRIKELYAALNGVPFAFQRVAAVAWSDMPGVEQFRVEMKLRRNALVTGLRAIGFTIDTERQNKAAMFVWAKIPEHCSSATEVTKQLAAAGVLVTDGTTLGDDSARHIRLALNEPIGVLADAVSRISKAMEDNYGPYNGALHARGSDERAA